jgi:hypothetical protein
MTMNRNKFFWLTMITVGVALVAYQHYRDASEPTTPTHFEFTVGGRNIAYFIVDERGLRSRVVDLDHLNVAQRVSVIVHLSEETPAVPGHYYVANLVDARVGSTATAELMTEEHTAARTAAATDAMSVASRVLREEERRRVQARREWLEARTRAHEEEMAELARRAEAAGWKPITVYCASWIPDCLLFKQWLDEKGIPHRYLDTDLNYEHHKEREEFVRVRNGKPAYWPVFRIGDDLMQGWDNELFLELAKLKRRR